MKKIVPNCEHIDFNNKPECDEPAQVMCMCCGTNYCREHGHGQCEYGGMGFIDLEPYEDTL